MSANDQAKWDQLHAARHGSDQPARFLNEILENGNWPLPCGRVLDIATGKGRNAIYLAARGFDVTAIDISREALEEARKRATEKAPSISWQQVDLEQIELPQATYDLVINFNYLQRSLIPQIKAALKLGGHVIFETYLIDQQEIGHPKNPAYLLGHNELLEMFRGFRVLWYREGKFSDGGEAAFRAAIFAQKVR
jgi:2-polyprenyl-3-methyl-5-hydroxy-6-metoxy-1,4-benzoquinol methylase